MRTSRVIALLFIVGFVGFLGAVFTGSIALAAVACGFFGGTTCWMALYLTGAMKIEPMEILPRPIETTKRPEPKREAAAPASSEPKYIRKGMVMVRNPNYNEKAEKTYAAVEIQPDYEELPYI